jgi:hypothetical protein
MDDFRPVAFETPPSHTPRDTAQRDFVLVLLPAPDYNTNVKFPPPFFYYVMMTGGLHRF